MKSFCRLSLSGCVARLLAPWIAILVPLVALQAQSNYATPYTFTTFAGSAGSLGTNDGTGSSAQFYNPAGAALDSSGNVYIADSGNHTIRKITSGGVVTTLAGLAGSPGSVNGTGSAARFSSPRGIAVDGSGNVYIADTGNHTIRKITSGGVVTTLAGSVATSGSADGTGSSAQFSGPNGLTVDTSGNVYVADTGNHTIRKITAVGVVTTVAGLASTSGSTDGTGSAARFLSPTGVAVDGSGILYVGDGGSNHMIRKIASGGVVTTLAGSPGLGGGGSTDGTGAAAKFNSPLGVSADSGGTVYVADASSQKIRKVTAGGVVTTLAGSAGNSGSVDGTGSAARFNSPLSLAVDGAGSVYVADFYNNSVRKVTAGGVVTTFAGAGSVGSADATGSAARFYGPAGIAQDSAGNTYVADGNNNTVRKITTAGEVTTLAGLAGSFNSTDGTGSAARFNFPNAVGVDTAGNIFIADMGNATIRKITPGGVVTTLAGLAGSSGSADGTGSAARFSSPRGLAVDGADNIYVADYGNHTVRKIAPGGVVTTIAGLAGSFGTNDGTGSGARFSEPEGVAVDGTGNVYVADSNNHTIRKIAPAGVVTTLAGSAGTAGSADGTGGAARFYRPTGLAVDNAGILYVVDSNNSTIRKVTADGVVTTLAGSALNTGSTDGTGSAARFKFPYGVSVDGSGHLYVADSSNNTIRKGVVQEVAPAITTHPINQSITAGANAAFTIAASGTPSPTYQWQRLPSGSGTWVNVINGGVYSGATTTTLTITAATIGLSGDQFRCVATNSVNSATSNVATLTVTATVAHDFNGTGTSDLVWQNTTTGARYVWFMSDGAVAGGGSLGSLSTDWVIASTADFNGDGKPDILWQNTITGEKYVWFISGMASIGGGSLGSLGVEWDIAAAADFNGDGKPDLLWQNTTTGLRYIWYMDGITATGGVSLGVVGTEWDIASAADFNGDGKPDILWQNRTTGDRYIWYMNGVATAGGVSLGNVSIDWDIAGTGDFNGDGKTDILWQNTSTGLRYIWFMDGAASIGGVSLGIVGLEWKLAD